MPKKPNKYTRNAVNNTILLVFVRLFWLFRLWGLENACNGGSPRPSPAGQPAGEGLGDPRHKHVPAPKAEKAAKSHKKRSETLLFTAFCLDLFGFFGFLDLENAEKAEQIHTK